MSTSLDLPDAGWDLVHLSGTLGSRARGPDEAPGARSPVRVECPRSVIAPAQPVRCLRRPATTEADGEAIGLALVYSGNFVAEVEVEAFGTARARIGIDPETFRWTLEPGEEFATPEAVIGWSADGMGDLSDAFHRLFRERLARGTWRDRPRPVKVNNWEGTYFDFDAERLLSMATVARDLGIELFVLDDGWFGKRDDDTTSLGDWVVDRRKLPDGVDGLARAIEALGLRFGLWIEPEMVSERQRAVRGPPGLGDRRARPQTDGGSPAARPRHGPARGRRAPLHGPLRRPRRALRSRTSSGT